MLFRSGKIFTQHIERNNLTLRALMSCWPDSRFTDLLGSGQQHLVRIRHNEIKCWPNLGRGRFGKGFVFATLPFTYAEFEASRVLPEQVGFAVEVWIAMHQDRRRVMETWICGC